VPHGRPDLGVRFEPAAAANRARSHGAQDTDVVVLTDGEEFHAAVKEAVTMQNRVWRVPTADQAADLLAAGRVGVLVIDTECVARGAPTLITQLNIEFPDLVVVVAGTHDEAPQFARLVSEGLVYRFLQKPVSTARVRAFIDAGLRRHTELVAEAPPAVHTRKGRRSSMSLWFSVALAAIVAIAVTLNTLRQHAAPQAAPATPQQDVRASGPRKETPDAQPFAAAETTRIAHDRAQRLQPDAEDTAKRAAMAKDQEARDQEAIERAAAAQARVSNPAASPPHAAKSRPEPVPQVPVLVPSRAAQVPPAQQLGVADADLAELHRGQMDSEQQSRADRLTDLARLAAQRLVDDKLIEPAGDNAREYLQQLQTEDPTLAAPLLQQLAERLLATARRELSRGTFDTSERWLKAAEDVGVNSTDVAAIRTEIEAARGRAAFLANVMPVGSLKNTRYVAPIYPPKALRQGIEGWVNLEFTLDPAGAVSDIVVKSAVPTGVFEKAAVDAVTKWRFQPVQRDGAAVNQRAAVRVQFKLER
jgi:TonB family protein